MPVNHDVEVSCVVRRTLAAPPERVYQAWTDPVLLAEWSWGSEFETLSVEQDCRPGGVWRQEIRSRETGVRWIFDGVFREVVPGKKLVHTFHWRNDKGDEEGPSLVTIELLPVAGKQTEVVITHIQLDPAKKDVTEAGWGEVLTGIERAAAL